MGVLSRQGRASRVLGLMLVGQCKYPLAIRRLTEASLRYAVYGRNLAI